MINPITTAIRLAGLGALAMVATMAAPKGSLAAAVTVTGGNGLDIGYLCAFGQVCPGVNNTNAVFSLVGNDPVTGSFLYTPGSAGTGTVSFSLTLNTNANFGGETLLAGSTFSAGSVNVSVAADGPGAVTLTETGSATGSANLLFSPGLAPISNNPLISALTCTIGTGSDQCGVSVGALGLEVGPGTGGANYNGFFNFNVSTTPVPLPAAAWLLISGLGVVGSMRRRRKLAALALIGEI